MERERVEGGRSVGSTRDGWLGNGPLTMGTLLHSRGRDWGIGTRSAQRDTETETEEIVCGQPTWFSGRLGLWVGREYLLELEARKRKNWWREVRRGRSLGSAVDGNWNGMVEGKAAKGVVLQS